jgi:hypothetical protein
MSLSKFRTPVAPPPAAEPVLASAPPQEAAPSEAPGVTGRGGMTLGRVRPLRLRAPDPDAPPKVDPLVRLLADF